jgi:hypothetical protein
VRRTGPTFRPDAPAIISSRDRFYEYEQGREAALRSESLSNHSSKSWVNGWHVGTRQRLYREACIEAPIQQLVELVAVGWTQKEIARALRMSESTVCQYSCGKRSFSLSATERIKVLYEEVKKAEEWISWRSNSRPGTGGDRPHRAAGVRAVETERASTNQLNTNGKRQWLFITK